MNAVESMFDFVSQLNERLRVLAARRSRLSRTVRATEPVPSMESWVLRGKFVHRHKSRLHRQHRVAVCRQVPTRIRAFRTLKGTYARVMW